jgi:hypothetical protein
MFICLCVGGLLAAALVWRELAPGPSACALVRVSKQPPHVLGYQQARGQADYDFETFRQNQVALVKSRMVLNAALHDRNVVPIFNTTPSPGLVSQFSDWLRNSKPQEPVEWLEDHIQVDFGLSPEIMRISVTGKNPDELIALVTAVRDAYLNEVRHIENKRMDRVVKMRSDCYMQLQEKRTVLKGLERENASTPAPALQRELLGQQLLDCKRERLRVRLARAAANAGKDKEAPAEDGRLAAQEQLLRDEETALLATADRLEKDKRNDAIHGVQEEIENLEGMLKQLNADTEILLLDRSAPSRIQAWDDVYIRNAK